MEKHPRIGIAVIVLKDNKVLLGKRKGAHGIGDWAPPGGHLEFGETVSVGAKRELLEETGLEMISHHLGPWTENIMENGLKHYITLAVFITEFSGELQLLEPEKCEGWHWFDWDALPSPLFSPFKSLIQKTNLEELKTV